MFNGANNAIQDNNCCLFFLLLVYIANNTDPEQTAPLADQHVRIQRGDRSGLDPLKNHKATKPAFNVGPSSARQ